MTNAAIKPASRLEKYHTPLRSADRQRMIVRGLTETEITLEGVRMEPMILEVAKVPSSFRPN